MTAIGEAAPSREKSRSHAVYGIRGLASLALLTVHVATFSGLFGTRLFGPPRPPSNVFGAFFVSGLPVFIGVLFVLPAMYLYLPIAKAVIAGQGFPAQGNNLMRRLFRLLPGYYLMFLVVLLALHRDAIDGVWYVLRPALLLHFYMPTPFSPNLMHGLEVTWTVPSMVQWYLVLPLIGWAAHRYARRGATPAIRARRLMLPVPLLIATGIGWLFFVKGQGWDNRIVFWWPQGFATTIGIGMALAVMLALAKVSPQDTPGLLRAAASRPHLFWLGALAVYLVNCARPFSVIGMDAIYSVSGLLATYLTVALFGLFASLPLIAPGARRVPLVDAILTNRPVVHLGRVSYGIYLWHFAVMHFYLQPGAIASGDVKPIRELWGKSGFWELEAATVIGTVLLASISYFLLERPVSAWANRRFADREPIAEIGGRTLALPARTDRSTTTDIVPAGSPVASTVADRDAIRSNLVDLERSFGAQLLSGAELSGRTKERWEAAVADLAAAWQLFQAYSEVVDEAVRAASNGHRRSGTATDLLDGPSILWRSTPAPLGQRHITDDGRTRLTPPDAVEQMNQLFRGTAELVTTVERIWTEVSGRLDEIRADLARVPADARNGALAEAESALDRLLRTLHSDPLSLWEDGKINTDELDALRRTASSTTAKGEGESDG